MAEKHKVLKYINLNDNERSNQKSMEDNKEEYIRHIQNENQTLRAVGKQLHEETKSQQKRIEELEKENKEFAEWCSDNEWERIPDGRWRSNIIRKIHETNHYKTTTELLDIFRRGKEKE